MIDFQLAYNDMVTAKQKYEADIQAQILINREKNRQYIQNRILLQNTFNSILNENLEGIKNYLGDKYIVTLGDDIDKMTFSSYDADDVICTYTNITIKPSDKKYSDRYLSKVFNYYKIKDYKWTTIDDLTSKINSLLGEFVADTILNGIKTIFGQYVKIE